MVKTFKITLIVLIAATVIIWLRDGQEFSLPELVPIFGGHELSRYDLGGLILIVIMVWGYARLKRMNRDDD